MRDAENLHFMREWYSTLAEEGHGRVEQEGLERIQGDERDGWDQGSVESEFRGRESEQTKDDEDKMVAVEEEGRKKAIKELWWTGTKSVLINVASIIMSITVHGDNSRGEGIISKTIPVEGEILTCDGGGRAYLWLSGLMGEKI